MITFVYPFVLFTLLPLTLFLLYLMLTNKDKISRVFTQEVLEQIKTKGSGLSKKTRDILFSIAIVLIVVALSRPLLLKDYQDYKPTYNVLLAMDTSQSMFSKDIYPSRYAFSKQKIIELLHDAKGINYSLALFNKDTFLIAPLSRSYDVLIKKLKNLEVGVMPTKADYLNLFQKMDYFFPKEGVKTVVIFTDGDNKREYIKEKEFLQNSDIKVLIVAVGTLKGAPLLDENEEALTQRWSRLNENVYTLATNEEVLNLKADSKLKETIIDFIDKNGIDKAQMQYDKYDKIELFKPLLIASLVLIFIASFSFPRFNKAVILFLLFSNASHVEAALFDFKHIENAQQAYEQKDYAKAVKEFSQLKRSAQRDYNIANSYYKLKEYKKALRFYEGMQTSDSDLSHKKFHNIANAHFMLGEYEKAVKNYEKALEFKKDEDTLANLEEAKKRLQKKDKDRAPSKSSSANKDETSKKQERSKNEGKKEDEKKASQMQPVNEQGQDKEQKELMKTKYKKYDRLLYKPKTQIIKIEEEN